MTMIWPFSEFGVWVHLQRAWVHGMAWKMQVVRHVPGVRAGQI